MSLLWASESRSRRGIRGRGSGNSKVSTPTIAPRNPKNNYTKILLLFVALSCTLSSANGADVADLG